jgi:hypothetical protein
MRKLAIGITGAAALLLAGILAWNAQATPLTGSTTLYLAANQSLVEKAAQGITCSGSKPYLCKVWCSGRWCYYCSPAPCAQ